MKKMTSGDYVYEEIRRRIITGKYKQGQKLKEVQIAEELKISPTPVRESLRKLSSEGFVERIPYKGVVVKTYSLQDTVDSYWVFCKIYLLYIEWSMNSLEEEQLKELENSLQKAIDLECNQHIFERVEPFFLLIRNYTSSQILENCLKNIQAIISIDKIISYSKDVEFVSEELFRGILRGIKSRDMKMVEEYFVRLINVSVESFLRFNQ